ncbi:uncharacterized protein LOC143236106 [Tachypleus tridentatus]|uniref:uncharacterized protein LOC143236106 n=1 Tax=Tachypleus tridentatus TaxID=6853 RepID=UPI003FD5F1C8
MPVGDQDKPWAAHFICEHCKKNLEGWYRDEKRAIKFAIPRIWLEPNDHSSNYYLCMVYPSKRRAGKRLQIDKTVAQLPPPSGPVPRFLFLLPYLTNLQNKYLFFHSEGIRRFAVSPKSVKKLYYGDILVETLTSKHSELLLNSKTTGDISTEVTVHVTLNSSRGVIVGKDLKNIPESEIFTGFSSQGISAVRRKNGSMLFDSVLVLTFTSPRSPATFKTGCLNSKVRPYVSNPLRCFQCQWLGH